MSNGEIALIDRRGIRVYLLDGEAAAVDGVWVEAWPFFRKAFHGTPAVESGGTVEIHASNAKTIPAAATGGVIIGTLNPSASALTDNSPWRWIKAKRTIGAGPASMVVIMEAKSNA